MIETISMLEATYDRLTGEPGAGRKLTSLAGSNGLARLETLTLAIAQITGIDPQSQLTTASAAQSPARMQARGTVTHRAQHLSQSAPTTATPAPAADAPGQYLALEKYERLRSEDARAGGEFYAENSNAIVKQEAARTKALRAAFREEQRQQMKRTL